jgi:hypothetical protein
LKNSHLTRTSHLIPILYGILFKRIRGVFPMQSRTVSQIF